MHRSTCESRGSPAQGQADWPNASYFLFPQSSAVAQGPLGPKEQRSTQQQEVAVEQHYTTRPLLETCFHQETSFDVIFKFTSDVIYTN